MVSMKPLAPKRSKNFFAEANGGTALVPMKHAGDPVLKELKEHMRAVEERLTAAKFANNILDYEEKEWKTLHNEAKAKLHTVKEANKDAVERLIEITAATVKKYEERSNELPQTINNLESTRDQLAEAIKNIETDQQLKDVTSMFDIHTFEAKKFDIQEHSRDIMVLLHTTDALLEITQ